MTVQENSLIYTPLNFMQFMQRFYMFRAVNTFIITALQLPQIIFQSKKDRE